MSFYEYYDLNRGHCVDLITNAMKDCEVEKVLDGIYDDVYLIMDMVIDSNLTKEGLNLFWNAYYESNIRDSETLWEIVKNNYNYEPTE